MSKVERPCFGLLRVEITECRLTGLDVRKFVKFVVPARTLTSRFRSRGASGKKELYPYNRYADLFFLRGLSMSSHKQNQNSNTDLVTLLRIQIYRAPPLGDEQLTVKRSHFPNASSSQGWCIG
jgi:hypothetical protein